MRRQCNSRFIVIWIFMLTKYPCAQWTFSVQGYSAEWSGNIKGVFLIGDGIHKYRIEFIKLIVDDSVAAVRQGYEL